MLVVPYPVRSEVPDGGETEGEVQSGEERVDAERGPAVFSAQLAQALGEREGGLRGLQVRGRVVGSVGLRGVVASLAEGCGEGPSTCGAGDVVEVWGWTCRYGGRVCCQASLEGRKGFAEELEGPHHVPRLWLVTRMLSLRMDAWSNGSHAVRRC